MRAGRLRHRVALQSSVETNDHGSISQAWATQATVWADIRPLSGRELDIARQVNAQITHEVEMRYPSVSLTPKMRVVFDSRTFEIDSVITPNEIHKNVVARCVEAV